MNENNQELNYNLAEILNADAEFISELESQRNIQSTKTYLSPIYYPNQRVLISSWHNTRELKISIPGETKVEEFGSLNKNQKIIGFKGIIVNSEIQAKQQEFINQKPEIPLCSTVGMKLINKDANDPKAYVKKLPEITPWSALQEWDNATKKYVNKPNEVIKKYDFLGSKGMRCVDCIYEGLNKAVGKNLDNNGQPNYVYCKVNAQIVIYITEVLINVNNQTKYYKVNELNPDLDEGIIVVMSLNDSAYKGIYLKEQKRLSGYLGYLIELSKIKGQAGYVYLHQTEIKLISEKIKNKEGKEVDKFALNFQSLNLASKENIQKAQNVWKKENPRQGEEIEYLNIENYKSSKNQDNNYSLQTKEDFNFETYEDYLQTEEYEQSPEITTDESTLIRSDSKVKKQTSNVSSFEDNEPFINEDEDENQDEDPSLYF